jgi:hypothetical protein
MNGGIPQLKKLWAMRWCALEEKIIFGDHTCGFGYWMTNDLWSAAKGNLDVQVNQDISNVTWKRIQLLSR